MDKILCFMCIFVNNDVPFNFTNLKDMPVTHFEMHLSLLDVDVGWTEQRELCCL